ncbi:MAG: ABC transporter permease [Thiobacillaceae bacterium]|jgi:phospholipid/cholesterol/gamma-HCH transport system permease protein|nr:ABC transporter permease [Thiobacillaceae bacterium]
MSAPPPPVGTDAFCSLDAGPEGAALSLRGAWTLANLAALRDALARLPIDPGAPLTVDGAALDALDSAGANRLIAHLDGLGLRFPRLRLSGFGAQGMALLHLVAGRHALPATAPLARRGFGQAIGWHVMRVGHATLSILTFIGQTGQAFAQLLRRPGLFRAREFFVQLEMVGLRAVPIVMLMSYLIGIVIAYLLGLQAKKYGANVFVVDGVGLAITRELAPLMTAVIVAGRSGAAFTAHLGAMKVNQEIDAIASLGLSPWQVLVLPRLLALVLLMPLLTAVADIAGILGAAQVASLHLGVTPHTFFDRLQDVLSTDTVLFGLMKTPVFALAIALIACHNGFSVARDARSVGLRTTATVVRSIVAVILIDSAFAVAYPELM